MQITKLSGAWVRMPSPTAFITFRLMPIRSSRLIPGLRRTPGGDDADVRAGDVGIIVRTLELRVIALDRAGLRQIERLALRHASTTSNRTISPSSRIAARWAKVPPILPAPISAIFLRAMKAPTPC
jgi:hypothetical protein